MNNTHAYVARCPCGGVVMMTVDNRARAEDVARNVSESILAGYAVERVEIGVARQLILCEYHGACAHPSGGQAPRQSQLTHSDFCLTVLALRERARLCPAPADVEWEIASLTKKLASLRDETRATYGTLPDALQSSRTGKLLEGRVLAVQGAINLLQALDVSFADSEQEEGESTDEYEERVEQERAMRAVEIWGEVQDALDMICS